MLKILDDPEGRLIISIAIVTLSPREQQELIEALQKKIRNSGKIRWYLELEDFDSNTSPALFQKHLPGIKDSFERIALVGNPVWHGWLTDLTKPLSKEVIRYFKTSDQDKAHAWVQE